MLINEKEKVIIETNSNNQYVLSGVSTQRDVLFKIISLKTEKETTRPNFDLVAVLDRSGSMSGKRLFYSKRAIKKLVKHLGKNDNFSFLIYDDKTQTVFKNQEADSPESKENLKSQIRSVRVRGSTNIEGALAEAIKILKNNSNNSNLKGNLQKIFLFSDGHANVGISTPNQMKSFLTDSLYNTDISISTFGIGDGFNEELMKTISDVGKGNYFYIKVEKDIPRTISKAIHSSFDTIGTEGTLKVKGITNDNSSSILLSINERENDLEKGEIVGDLISGETKQVLTSIKILPTLSQSTDKEINVINYSFQYTDSKTKEIVTIEGKHSFTITNNSELVLSMEKENENSEIVLLRASEEFSKRQKEISNLIDSRKTAKAIEKSKDIIKDLNKFKDKSTKFAKLLEKSENTLKSLETNKIETAKKEIDFASYISKRKELDYYSGSDSEEEYSDEDEEAAFASQDDDNDDQNSGSDDDNFSDEDESF